jgi:ankyrin repeat protein
LPQARLLRGRSLAIVSADQINVTRFMQNRTDTPASSLWQAARKGDRDAIGRLVVEGVDVNVWDEYGRSALTFAASTGQLEVAKDLLRAGAWVDPHEDYDTYMTPLAEAAQRGDREMVSLFLEHGADPTMHVGVAQMTAARYADLFPDLSQLLRDAENAKRA